MSNRKLKTHDISKARALLAKSLWVPALVAGISMSGNAMAWGIVHDPIQTAKHIAEFKQQLDRWRQTAEHYRQQLISLGGMSVAPTALNNPNADFPMVDPNYGLEHACRANRDGGLIGTVKNVFRPDPNKDILEQQLDICQRIVRAENLKYNETVKYLNNLRARQRELDKIDLSRKGVGREKGKLDSITFDVNRYEQGTKMDMDNWQAMMMAYDSYISQLNKYQQRLAQRALRGQQPDILTTVVQGAVLKSVLESEKNKD